MDKINRVFRCGNESFFLFGPRGIGKTTWLKDNLTNAYVVDLLKNDIRLRLMANPERLRDMVAANDDCNQIVIDEIQKAPALLDVVHSLMEEFPSKRFVLTGSSARKLKRAGVDLLGGRALELKMHPFMACELGESFDLDDALMTGLVPVIGKYANKERQLAAYLQLYIREEVEQEGLVRNLDAFARFLEAMAFSHAGVLSASEISRECMVKRATVDGYIQILRDLLIGGTLPVFSKRAKRRMVTHEKFYYFDVGVFRKLRPIGRLDSPADVNGQALEGLVYQHLCAYCDYSGYENALSYWRTSNGAEVDFVVYTPDDFTAFEVKHSDRVSRSDMDGLKLFGADYSEAKRILLYRGKEQIMMDGILVVPVERYLKELIPGKCLPENAWMSTKRL